MLRLISGNAGQGVRPVLLLKVRSNKGSIQLPSSPAPIATSQNTQSQQYSFSTPFIRSNSTTTIKTRNPKVDSFLAKTRSDPLIRDAFDGESQAKLQNFRELMVTSMQKGYDKSFQGRQAFSSTVTSAIQIFDDQNVRSILKLSDLNDYVTIINKAVYLNRTNRLSGSNNRDNDDRNQTYTGDLALKDAVLTLSEIIMGGEFKEILNVNIIQSILYSMVQYQFYPEMISFWENGVNDPKLCKVFLEQQVLAIILMPAFTTKRFTYEEILSIVKVNFKEDKPVHHTLLCTLGKIALSAGDNSRGFEALEGLLEAHDTNKSDRRKVLHSLNDLHLNFIGVCKDISIATHFFDRVVKSDAPYNVILKVPYVVHLLNNCVEANEPFDNIVYFWKNTLKYYSQELRTFDLKSRYSLLNNAFFKIFFESNPVLTNESLGKLKEIMSIYTEIKEIDETFLNTVITNYTWGDKQVLEELIANYDVYNIDRTQVSYRIPLKKMGQVKDYTSQDILDKWNQSLAALDAQGYRYIPVADWAALRDATIQSAFPDQRLNLYLAIVSAYKNFMQDRKSCLRFLGSWVSRTEHIQELFRITKEEQPNFNVDTDIFVPRFKTLKENVNYREITADFVAQRSK